MMKRILVLNGPNLNLLGTREPELYGETDLEKIEKKMSDMITGLEVELELFQSNHEGDLVDKIHLARGRVDCIIINAGGLSHYSVVLHDALKGVKIPAIEVHLTNIYSREEFRHQSLIAPVVVGGIFGLGATGYYLALEAALQLIGMEREV